jgi:hypothetical protein
MHRAEINILPDDGQDSFIHSSTPAFSWLSSDMLHSDAAASATNEYGYGELNFYLLTKQPLPPFSLIQQGLRIPDWFFN